MIELNGDDYASRVGGRGLNIVAFKDDWCPWCRDFVPVFKKYEKLRADDIHFYLVDRDANKEFTKSQGVTTVPTIILFRDGRELGRTEDDLSDSDFGRWLESKLRG